MTPEDRLELLRQGFPWIAELLTYEEEDGAAILGQLREAVEEEREACARIAEGLDMLVPQQHKYLCDVAEAIRARGQSK